MELNPNHPVTSKMHDQWHKIVLLLLARIPQMRTIITLEEITRIAEGGGVAITIKEVANGLELRAMTMDEGRKLAAQEGGLPV